MAAFEFKRSIRSAERSYEVVLVRVTRGCDTKVGIRKTSLWKLADVKKDKRKSIWEWFRKRLTDAGWAVTEEDLVFGNNAQDHVLTRRCFDFFCNVIADPETSGAFSRYTGMQRLAHLRKQILDLLEEEERKLGALAKGSSSSSEAGNVRGNGEVKAEDEEESGDEKRGGENEQRPFAGEGAADAKAAPEEDAEAEAAPMEVDFDLGSYQSASDTEEKQDPEDEKGKREESKNPTLSVPLSPAVPTSPANNSVNSNVTSPDTAASAMLLPLSPGLNAAVQSFPSPLTLDDEKKEGEGHKSN